MQAPNSSEYPKPFDFIRSPTPTALDAARQASIRAKKNAPVRVRFLERAHAGDPSPVLARILRGGGRGGEVRLKLLLSMLWLVRDNPAPVLAYPSRAWANLLDLPEPASKGARRINEALAWLESNSLVVTEKQPNRIERLVTLLNETGNGQPYELPGAAIKRLASDAPGRDGHVYIQLPGTLWANGWITMLSGAAVAMLALLYRQLAAGDPADSHLWFAPSDAKLRFDLSDDTRSKGLRELTKAGLITMERRSVDPASFDYERVRNVYRLQPSQLMHPAALLDWDEIKIAAPATVPPQAPA